MALHAGGLTYRLQYVNCGKRRCKTCGGRSYAHGPYWYAFQHQGGRVRSFYVGKERPAVFGEQWQEPRPVKAKPATDPWSVLGVERGATPEQLKRAYRAAAFSAHPDRGGSGEKMKAINVAYDVLRGRRRR